MDFLDPRKTRAHRLRLMIGYVLVAIAIGLGTVILVYGAYGYGVNTKTGDVVQNGLLFVDSQPGGADIYLNGKLRTTTSARLVLPAGNYDLRLQKDGYRPWERKFELDGHTIERYVYPFLFPEKPVTAALKTYSSQPPLITQSPDRHWLLAQSPQSDDSGVSFDQYDANDPEKPATTIKLPAGLLTNAGSSGSRLSEVEWSTDNNHLLLLHKFAGGNEFIIMDRNDPAKSINVNKLFNTTPTQVALRNKKANQLYIYHKENGSLSVADTGKGTVAAPILRNILAFKAYGNDIIDYVTQVGVPAGQAQARIWDKGKSYPLYTFATGKKYLLDTASYSGHDYYVAGSDAAGRANLYKDPLQDIKDPAIGKAIPVLALYAKGANKISFSDNARFIGAEGGQNFAVYDLETDRYYHYALKHPLPSSLHWMDGHRLIGASGGKVFVMDYDATNQQALVPTVSNLGGFFDRDYKQMYTLAPVAGSKSVILERVDMRAGSDLPKQ